MKVLGEEGEGIGRRGPEMKAVVRPGMVGLRTFWSATMHRRIYIILEPCVRFIAILPDNDRFGDCSDPLRFGVRFVEMI